MIKLLTVFTFLLSIVAPIQSFVPAVCSRPVQRNSVDSSTAIFYFDDISRRRSSPNSSSIWTPSILDQIHFASSPCTSTPKVPDYGKEKLEQLQKSLFGYDAATARQLTAIEVQAVIQRWLDSVNFDSEFFTLSSDHRSSRNVKVCNGESVIECLSDVWDSIDDSRAKFQTTRSKGKSRSNSYKNDMSSHIELIIFPLCPDMYNYKIVQRTIQELRECYQYCSSFGKEYVVSAFHPNFNNEPRMLSPIRHSPFPCIGLHTRRRTESEEIGPLNEMLTMNSIIHDNIDGNASNKMETVDHERKSLESIFNTEAVTGSYNDAMVESIAVDEEVLYFVEQTQHWMTQQCKNENNSALRYCDSIGDRWSVTSSRLEETIYREVWKTILEVLKVKKLQDQKREALDASAILIASNFSLYNAQRFKRIAVSINKSLRNAKCDISMELFHPEFVGQNDAASYFRRSPFPTLQIVICSTTV